MSFVPSLYCLLNHTETCSSSLRNAEHFLYSEYPGIIFSSIEAAGVIFFWIVNFFLVNDDFTKAHITVLMVPLSASTVTKLWSVTNSVGGASVIVGTYGDISYFIDNLYGALITTSQLYVMMGSIGFTLLLVVTLVQQRRCHDKVETWVGFCTIAFVSLILGLLNYFVDLPYRGLPRFMITLTVLLSSVVLAIFAVLSLITVLLKFRQKCACKDPLVRDAKDRLIFAVFAAILILPPCWYSLLHFSIFFLTSTTTTDDEARTEWILRIVQFITAPVIVPAIFVLKPYHCAAAALLNKRKMSIKNNAAQITSQRTQMLPLQQLQSQHPQLTYPVAAPSQLSGDTTEKIA